MLNLAQVNGLSREKFVRAIGPAFEHSPWIAERTWKERPFESVAALHEALCDTVQRAGADEELALITAHPDLVGRALLTQESQSEQASAGLGHLSADEVAEFDRLNRAYRERFGFPFVICARLNKKEKILRAFTKRLANARAKEIGIAVEEIYKIAELRLRDLFS